jgi:hypothetical protein
MPPKRSTAEEEVESEDHDLPESTSVTDFSSSSPLPTNDKVHFRDLAGRTVPSSLANSSWTPRKGDAISFSGNPSPAYAKREREHRLLKRRPTPMVDAEEVENDDDTLPTDTPDDHAQTPSRTSGVFKLPAIPARMQRSGSGNAQVAVRSNSRRGVGRPVGIGDGLRQGLVGGVAGNSSRRDIERLMDAEDTQSAFAEDEGVEAGTSQREFERPRKRAKVMRETSLGREVAEEFIHSRQFSEITQHHEKAASSVSSGAYRNSALGGANDLLLSDTKTCEPVCTAAVDAGSSIHAIIATTTTSSTPSWLR